MYMYMYMRCQHKYSSTVWWSITPLSSNGIINTAGNLPGIVAEPLILLKYCLQCEDQCLLNGCVSCQCMLHVHVHVLYTPVRVHACVLLLEVPTVYISLVRACVLLSEGPLVEVPLYTLV